MRLDWPIEIAPEKMEATIGAGVTEIRSLSNPPRHGSSCRGDRVPHPRRQ
jgi:hypothetical protein